jgi:hypothetical protein
MSNRDPDFDMDYLEGIVLGLHFAVIFIIAALKLGNFHSFKYSGFRVSNKRIDS